MTWDDVGKLTVWLDANWDHRNGDPRIFRILKITEEVGEVAEAVFAATGTNPRKEPSTWEHVHTELADVIVTAMVALLSCTDDAHVVLEDRLRALVERARLK